MTPIQSIILSLGLIFMVAASETVGEGEGVRELSGTRIKGWLRRILTEELYLPSMSWYVISSLSLMSEMIGLSLMSAVTNSWEAKGSLECLLREERALLTLFYYMWGPSVLDWEHGHSRALS